MKEFRACGCSNEAHLSAACCLYIELCEGTCNSKATACHEMRASEKSHRFLTIFNVSDIFFISAAESQCEILPS